MNPRSLPADMVVTEEREIERDMLRHAAFEIAARLYENFEPQDAHWTLTTAIIAADREYRTRKANGNA